MQMSNEGRELLAEWEGAEPRVYSDVAGFPTIGVGHLLTRDELSSGKIVIGGKAIRYEDGLSPEQIDALLQGDLMAPEVAVNLYVTQTLAQNQFDALVSFVFNVGRRAFAESTLLKKLNAGIFEEVPAQMRRWVYSGGRRIAGLVNRRENEVKLWNRSSASTLSLSRR